MGKESLTHPDHLPHIIVSTSVWQTHSEVEQRNHRETLRILWRLLQERGIDERAQETKRAPSSLHTLSHRLVCVRGVSEASGIGRSRGSHALERIVSIVGIEMGKAVLTLPVLAGTPELNREREIKVHSPLLILHNGDLSACPPGSNPKIVPSTNSSRHLSE